MTVSPEELTASNFRLSLEVRSLRAEMTQLKALHKYEDSVEVSRIKAAYQELENEVVNLRREKLLAVAPPQPILVEPPSPPVCEKEAIVNMLKEQLAEERDKYRLLAEKYDDLRRDKPAVPASHMSVTYSEATTSAGSSPLCYKSANFSIEKLEPIIEIKPVMEEMFKVTGKGRRVTPFLSDVPPVVLPSVKTEVCSALMPTPVESPIITVPSIMTTSTVAPLTRQRVRKNDESIQRLAKIAKYKL